jgi:hypothetical protein
VPIMTACSSISRVKDGGTDVYWAPGETRAVKAKLAGGAKVSLCEAADNDAWFGVVFAAPGTDQDMCGVGKSVPNAREYQGPCRWAGSRAARSGWGLKATKAPHLRMRFVSFVVLRRQKIRTCASKLSPLSL